MYPPGKMYLRVHASVTPGGPMRPQQCDTITPSGASNSRVLAKKPG